MFDLLKIFTCVLTEWLVNHLLIAFLKRSTWKRLEGFEKLSFVKIFAFLSIKNPKTNEIHKFSRHACLR